jgi:hypothetical protein
MTTKNSRGIRNNNPGNIEKGQNWIGLSDKPVNGQETLDKRFDTFQSAVYGIRAIARVLIAYNDKHDIHTIEGIVNRWAPAHENNVEAYIGSMADTANLPRNAVLDFYDYETMYALVTGIIKHENGKQPYSKGQIDKGLALAGIKPDDGAVIIRSNKCQVRRNNLNRSAIGGVGLAGAAEATRAITTISQDVEPILNMGVTVLIFIVLGVLFYNYWDEIHEFFINKFNKEK